MRIGFCNVGIACRKSRAYCGKSYDGIITVKNGTFNQKAKQPFINVDYSAAALYKTINLAFIDMTVKSTYTSTNWSILANYSNTKANFNGKVSVTLTDCIVDFTGTTKKSNLIHAGSTAGADNAEFTININGGKFIADNIANYTIYGIAERDIINFGVGKDGKYSVDNENWTTSVPDEATMQVKFNLDPAYLGNYVISQDGKTLITSLSAENAKEVLGLEITSLVGEVSLTVSNNGTYLTGLTIMYTITINGAESQVVIDTSYTYSPVVSDDANDETDGEGAEE